MDTQQKEVRHKIRKAEDEIVEIKQDLVIAKQARNRGVEEDTKFLRGQLLSLNNLLSSLQEKENLILRSQAPTSGPGRLTYDELYSKLSQTKGHVDNKVLSHMIRFFAADPSSKSGYSVRPV